MILSELLRERSRLLFVFIMTGNPFCATEIRKVDDKIIEKLIETRKLPPEPLRYLPLGGKLHRLQSYDGRTARYVPSEKWDADAYSYNRLTITDLTRQLEDEFSIMSNVTQSIADWMEDTLYFDDFDGSYDWED